MSPTPDFQPSSPWVNVYGTTASIIPRDPIRFSQFTTFPTPGSPWTLNDDEITASFSGYAFSVTKARGKFKSPCGQLGSSQKVRKYATTFTICSGVSRSLNDGMICENPRAGPPLVTMARHCTSGSGVEVGQSVKSGNVEGRSNPARFCVCPLPSGPWQETHPALKISSPVSNLSLLLPGCASSANPCIHTVART